MPVFFDLIRGYCCKAVQKAYICTLLSHLLQAMPKTPTLHTSNCIEKIMYWAVCMALGGLMFGTASCSGKRFIPTDKYLLKKNKLELSTSKTTFSNSDLTVLYAQQPNGGFFGIRPALWIHFVTQHKTEKRFWRWVHNRLGTAPVYYDPYMTGNACMQMQRYLDNTGYFGNNVTPKLQVEYNKIAKLTYQIEVPKPYRISEILYSIPDSTIHAFIGEIQSATLLKAGDVYNAYTIDNERDRITNYLKNNGYYYFTKDYIHFEADSNTTQHSIRLNMMVENRRIFDPASAQFVEEPHQRYFIRKVQIFPNHNPFIINNIPIDTSTVTIRTDTKDRQSPLYFLTQGNPRIKRGIFNQVIQIYEYDPFSLYKLRQTYKALGNLKIFRASNISFDTIASKKNLIQGVDNWIDCNIYLQRSQVHAYTVEVEGTNSAGDLGLRGSIAYTNKNLFRGAEMFRLRLNGGYEAQRLVLTDIEQGETSTSLFNTSEIGIDASIYFPRFLNFFNLRNFTKEYQPRSNISLGINSQTRTYYERTVLRLTFGYDWMANKQITHQLSPVNISSIKVNPSESFAAFLNEQSNQRFRDQYSDHLILSMRYSFVFNNQNIHLLKDFFYYRLNLESSGNLLSLIDGTSLFTNQGNYQELFGIRYAQFLRFDQDFRYYRVLSKENRLAFRSLIGIGFSYGNSTEMPFERSFYAGGANGMRGWQYRQLGPGSFSDPVMIERIGDIQLEFNAEYRFPIYDYLKGAVFVDVGNIWTLRQRETYPNGVFKLDSFYQDLAVDAGIGFRFDFSFFVFRLDAATPIRDPARSGSDRWMLDQIRLNNFVWNFGIGYPF